MSVFLDTDFFSKTIQLSCHLYDSHYRFDLCSKYLSRRVFCWTVFIISPPSHNILTKIDLLVIRVRNMNLNCLLFPFTSISKHLSFSYVYILKCVSDLSIFLYCNWCCPGPGHSHFLPQLLPPEFPTVLSSFEYIYQLCQLGCFNLEVTENQKVGLNVRI